MIRSSVVASEAVDQFRTMPLERELVEKNLKGLARSPDNLAHVFTNLELPEKGIDSVEVLKEFPHLQVVPAPSLQ